MSPVLQQLSSVYLHILGTFKPGSQTDVTPDDVATLEACYAAVVAIVTTAGAVVTGPKCAAITLIALDRLSCTYHCRFHAAKCLWFQVCSLLWCCKSVCIAGGCQMVTQLLLPAAPVSHWLQMP